MVNEVTGNGVILVADDDADIRGIVAGTLSAVGYRIIEASRGDEAWELFTKDKPVLCIIDWMMPGLSGPELCAKIKAAEGGNLVPVILLTARDSIKDKVSALEGGADEYVTKPFNYQELQARVRALLRVRELSITLQEKNRLLNEMQEKLVQKERQEVVYQLAGTAAHRLGQPLSAIMLNCHLVETLPKEDIRHQKALAAIKEDSKRMAELIEKLRNVDASKREEYFGETDILDIKEE